MKNILILDSGKEWGGGTNSLLELLRRIDKKNYNFTVLFYYNYDKPGESDIKTEIEKLGIDFLLFKNRQQSLSAKILKEIGRVLLFFNRKLRKVYTFWVDYSFRIKKDAERIVKLIKDLNIDLLYMNNQPSSNLEGIIAAKMMGIKSLLHGRIETELNFFEVNAVNKWLTKIICVSDGVKNNFVRQGIEPSKCIVVHNGIDITIMPAISSDKIRENLNVGKDAILIGSVGSLIKRKRFNDLIKAIARLRGQGSGSPRCEAGVRGQKPEVKSQKIKCVIVGDGPKKESLQKEISKNKLDDIVTLTGFKSDAISYINAMDIFVLPSEREGFPRVILEAMLMGKPVVASKITGTTELIMDGETGFQIQLKSIEELAGRILDLISSAKLRVDMGLAGRKRVIENFSLGKYVNHVSSILAEVTE